MKKFCSFIVVCILLCLAVQAWAAPNPPVMSHEVDGLNLSISWTNVPDATSYTLYYAPYPYTGPDTIGSLGMETATSYSIDLWEGATYYIAVRANKGQESSDYSNIGIFLIQSQGQTSQIPRGMITYSDTPVQNEGLTLSLVIEDDLREVTWEVMTEPPGSRVMLSESADNLSVTFTPIELGEYRIAVHSVGDNFEKIVNFSIRPTFTFDESKIDGNDGNVNISEIIGVIKNQSWVYSSTLSESRLRSIVSHYSDLTAVGFDDIQGLLIEYDENNIQLTGSLEALKQEAGISSVVNRVYEGENVPRYEAIPPDDGSGFEDGGDNWHLENIEVIDAWQITTGNPEILIGVSDSGFDQNHPELANRVSELLTTKISSHGNGVAGAIGAFTDNGEGMSGINWISQMVLGYAGYNNLISIIGRDNVLTTNSSWAIPGLIPASFDPYDLTTLAARDVESLARTRIYRRLTEAYSDDLFVWSAGNGIGNGIGNSGVYGIDGRHHSPALHFDDNGILSKQENVIFVAAMESDNRLRYSSNYGESIDLAAPTRYKSLGVDEGYNSSFGGTSAAAPVVTGVSSLIYSLFPDFTGKEVRDILIDSATSDVTERYIAPGGAGTDNSNIETLVYPIPRLNAGKALELAKQIADNRTDNDNDGFTENDGDCDDSSALLNPDTVWYLDADSDSYSDGTQSVGCETPGNGYVLSQSLTSTQDFDCDDSSALVNPDTVWYLDADGDSYSDGTQSIGCENPGAGYVLSQILISTQDFDCDDADPLVVECILIPEAPELSYVVDGTSISLSWDPVSDATGYRLNYAVAPYAGPADFVSEDLGNQTSYSYTPLVEGETYTIALQAYNDAGNSGYSNIESFTVPESQPPIPPTGTTGLSDSYYGLYRIVSVYSNNNGADCPTVGVEFYVTDDESLKDGDQYLWIPKDTQSTSFSGLDIDADPYTTSMTMTTNTARIREVGTWSDGSGRGWSMDLEIDFQNLSFHMVSTDDSPNYCIGVTDATLVGLGQGQGPPSPLSDFTNNGDGTVTDKETGLIWQQSDDGQFRDWQSSIDYCDALTLGGSSSWRLPTYGELSGIVNEEYSPIIDPIFTETKLDNYWSSTPGQYSDSTDPSAWIISFLDDQRTVEYLSYYNGTNYVFVKHFARCVR